MSDVCPTACTGIPIVLSATFFVQFRFQKVPGQDKKCDRLVGIKNGSTVSRVMWTTTLWVSTEGVRTPYRPTEINRIDSDDPQSSYML